ncbi:MAG: triacylglycerol lipase [Clostridia bacterium]|nr:triacylglycerol lipase [Clostridia bacterium]
MLYICIGLFLVFILCLFNVINITKKLWIAIWSVLLPHSLLYSVYAFQNNESVVLNIILAVLLVLLIFYILLRYNIKPYPGKPSTDRRLNILIGGRKLLLTGIYALLAQSVLYIIYFNYKLNIQFDNYWIIADIIINIAFILMLFINGFWRIILLSRRLNIFKKLLYAFLIWIPPVNLFVILALNHAATIEKDHELYKINQNAWRVDSQICKTKYPLLLLHGVGFRDLKYLNYWGRIPKQLVKNGASVYYGNQEAWGTIEANAEDVKKKILEITKEKKGAKVNIIAHSKGGLDARYTISKLGMDDYVASLTTISTPHRGSFILDFALKLPKKLFSFIGRLTNKYFKKIGDTNPDFETACRQFLTENAKEFNEQVKDSDKVYYQSYTSIMSRAHSDFILFFPYLIGRFQGQKSDGLVAPESAKWGEFKGVIETERTRGISHGDIIDLRRNDYKGFDVREFYVKLVNELKNKGF